MKVVVAEFLIEKLGFLEMTRLVEKCWKNEVYC